MGGRGLNRELVEFIAHHIRSVGQLEALQLLRSESERAWSATEVGRALRTSDSAAVLQLHELHACGLVSVTTEGQARYRYSPATDGLDEMVGRLLDVYRTRRVSVTREIHSRRSQSLQWFSDSFRMRED